MAEGEVPEWMYPYLEACSVTDMELFKELFPGCPTISATVRTIKALKDAGLLKAAGERLMRRFIEITMLTDDARRRFCGMADKDTEMDLYNYISARLPLVETERLENTERSQVAGKELDRAKVKR